MTTLILSGIILLLCVIAPILALCVIALLRGRIENAIYQAAKKAAEMEAGK